MTVGQYKAFIRATGHKPPDWSRVAEWSPTDQHPMIWVSWHDAMAYSIWAGKRLPTEAEWEYAARGGLVGKRYPWGDTIDSSKANYDYNIRKTTPVGRYAANGYGLYDMCGNVYEWCLDEYDGDFYGRSRRRNPVSGVSSIQWLLDNHTNVSTARVLRGFSWANSAGSVRSARRWRSRNTSNVYGFRCVMPAP